MRCNKNSKVVMKIKIEYTCKICYSKNNDIVLFKRQYEFNFIMYPLFIEQGNCFLWKSGVFIPHGKS